MAGEIFSGHVRGIRLAIRSSPAREVKHRLPGTESLSGEPGRFILRYYVAIDGEMKEIHRDEFRLLLDLGPLTWDDEDEP